MIIHSAFATFMEACYNVAVKQNKFPKDLYEMMREQVVKQFKQLSGGIDMETLNPIEKVPHLTIPCFFTQSHIDDIIPPEHQQRLFDAYAGPKDLFFYTDLESS